MLKGIPEIIASELVSAMMNMGHSDEIPAAWHTYRDIIEQEADRFGGFEQVDRFAFYDRAKLAYAIVTTRDKEYNGNLIFEKMVCSMNEG